MTEETIFQEALTRSAAERAHFLDQACSGQPLLRAAVEALLVAHEKPSNLLDKPPGNLAATLDSEPAGPDSVDREAGIPKTLGAQDPPVTRTGTADYRRHAVAGMVIGGRYTLQEKIGEGGMGEVWVAKQTEPIKRKVALKLIKTGMDSRAVVQRFEQERQALALMDHTNIARVLDGGITPTGQPFFVMELVNGLPLTQFCDEMKLTPKERLELFVPICQAVQHAHQKGIVHRDLKPANILVTMIDGKPIPKVIDFGVAKATSGKLTEETMSTGFGAVVGTLEYMSPEQAGFCGEDIDTRADIYSLGVILYELLTGLRPLDGKRLRKAAMTEMIRIIREEEPSKPSTRLSTDKSLPSLAAARHIEPRRLTALLRGELDWVVMKCLEKHRERRYETANGLARDIQRYLADEVVEARPPSTGYRLQKFIRRYKGQAIAACLVLLALVGGVVGTSIGMVLARRANLALADKNAELAEEQAKVQARFELAQQAIATFHTGVSEDALLANEQFEDLRTKLLKEAARFYGDLEKLLKGQVDSKSRKLLAEGYFQLGGLTKSIGDQPAALVVHRKALDLRRELASDPGANVETQLAVPISLREVGLLLDDTGEPAEAIKAWKEQRDVSLALEPISSNGAAKELAALANNSLGFHFVRTSRLAEAQVCYENALSLFQELAAGDPTNIQFLAGLAQTHLNLGNLLRDNNSLAEALAAHERALTIRQRLASENPSVTRFQTDLSASLVSVGFLLFRLGRTEESLAAYQNALRIRQKLADAQPAVNKLKSNVAESHYWIASVLSHTNQPEGAVEEYQKALAIQQRLTDANPTVTNFQQSLAMTLSRFGDQLAKNGQPTEAIAAYQKAMAVMQKLVDANPTLTDFQFTLSITESALSHLLFHMGRTLESLATFHQARNRLQKLVDSNPTVTRFQAQLGRVQNYIGYIFARTGQPAEGLVACEQGLVLRRKLADTNPTTPSFRTELASSYNTIGRIYASQGRFAEAFDTFESGLSLRQKLVVEYPNESDYTVGMAYCYAYRGWARVRAGQSKEAAIELRKVIELITRDKTWDLDLRFERVRSLALLAGLGADEKSGVTQDEAGIFADQCAAELAEAIKDGWANLMELKEPDLDVMRDREDFQKHFAALEAARLTKPVKTTSLPTEKP
ncbi:MAG: protein kinase [Pirellulaceae bacterium]|nr:protein kinase [Pirellulaceae bacterium]